MDKRHHPGPSKEEIRMNMASLQRIDPFICQIVQSASQVALYKYINNEWDKTDIEGTLFVYERQCDPKFGFLILNRRSATNWIQPIVSDIDTQLQPPFLLYKTKEGEIFGIWFYELRDCEQVGQALTSLVKRSEKPNRAMTASGGADLAALLMKASSQAPDADKKTAASKASLSGGEKLLRLLSREVDAMPPNVTGMNSVAAFFAQASQQEQNPLASLGISGVPVSQAMIPGFVPSHQQVGIFPFGQNPAAPKEPSPEADSQRMLQSLLANPGVVSVESLERAHRVGSPPASMPMPMTSSATSEMPPMPLQATKADDLEADLKSKLQLNQNRAGSGNRGGKRGNSSTPSGRMDKGQPQQQHQQHQQQQQRHQQLHQGKQQPTAQKPSYASAVAGEPSKPAAQRSPAPPKHHQQQHQHLQQQPQPLHHQKLPPPQQQQQQHQPPQQHQAPPQLQQHHVHPQQQHQLPPGALVDIRQQLLGNMVKQEPEAEVQLLSPMVFAASDAAAVAPTAMIFAAPACQLNGTLDHVEPLTRGQFVQALVHLLRTDDQFVSKLHQAYVETLNTKLH